MRVAINTIIATIATTATAFAANGAAPAEPGILAWGFMGFCALVLAGQVIPAALLVIGAVKGLAVPTEARNHN